METSTLADTGLASTISHQFSFFHNVFQSAEVFNFVG